MRGTPYLYVFSGAALVDGASYLGLTLPLHNDSTFLLRHVSGINSIAGQWRMYDSMGRPCSDAVQQTAAGTRDHAVVPESGYPRGSRIQLDLGTVARLDANVLSAARNYYPAQAVFQGVKLTGMPATSELALEPGPDRQGVLPCTHAFQLTLNWAYWLDWPAATTANSERYFTVPIQDHDFWLHDIQVLRPAGVPPQDSSFAIVLYGADRETPLMSAPVLHWHLNSTLNVDLGSLLPGNRVSRFPYPGVYYPKGGEIRMAIVSLVANDDGVDPVPRTYLIYFRGIRRES